MTEQYVPTKEYVEMLCYKHDHIRGVTEGVFILKDRPEWQKGKLNLPGGRVEPGETPEQTMVREMKEETGLDVICLQNLGVIKDRDFIIHCFVGTCTDHYAPFSPREGETEVPEWMKISAALLDKRLIPNLRVIVPLLQAGIKGWEIRDDAKHGYQPSHSMTVTVPTYWPVT